LKATVNRCSLAYHWLNGSHCCSYRGVAVLLTRRGREGWGGATATETLHAAVINRANSHNLAKLLLRNVAYEKLNLTISLHRKQIFNVFYFKTYGK